MKAKVIKTGEIVEVYHEPQHGQTTNIYKECVLLNGRMWSEDELDFCIKTSEAPEKIYISPAGVLYKGDKQQNNDIEYVRKDAFIEKACEGIEHLLSGYIIRNFHFGDSYEMDMLIEDFKNYMKGE